MPDLAAKPTEEEKPLEVELVGGANMFVGLKSDIGERNVLGVNRRFHWQIRRVLYRLGHHHGENESLTIRERE